MVNQLKVKGSSLYFALIISLLVAMLCSSFILTTSWHWISTEQYLDEHRLINNCQSGLNLFMSPSYNKNYAQDEILDLYGDGNDSVQISIKQWGIYDVVTSRAFAGREEMAKTMLIGGSFDDGEPVALYLCDRNSPLSLCGRTLVKGTVYLPEAGVKRAYVEGQTFVGDKLINGIIRKSNAKLPPLPSEIASLRNLDFSDNTKYEHVEFEDLTSDSISISFLDMTLVINCNDSISLTGIEISGNVIIKSSAPLYVSRDCKLNKTLLFAPRIYVEDYSIVNAQLYAWEKLKIGENCKFEFPSVLAVLSGSNTASSYLSLGERSHVFGSVIFHGKSSAQSHHVVLSTESIITGQVYSNVPLDIKGSVYGQLLCKELRLKTPSSVYENLLLNVSIDASRLPDKYPGISFLNSTSSKQIISDLE